MLTVKPRMSGCTVAPAKQAGAVLFIAIIVLVVMTLAGIALMRSIDTSNLIAGNLAFHESATHSGDTGAEVALAWLQANNSSVLDSDHASNGYIANGINAAKNPTAGQSWDSFWAQSLASRSVCLNGCAENSAGNKVYYVIDRMCSFAGSQTGGATCASSPLANPVTGNAEVAGKLQLSSPSLVYYRITSRVVGPRNSVSYVQVMVAL